MASSFSETIVPRKAAAGDHFIAVLQIIDHRLPLLLPPLLRHDQQKVKDGKDKYQGGKTQPPGRNRQSEMPINVQRS